VAHGFREVGRAVSNDSADTSASHTFGSATKKMTLTVFILLKTMGEATDCADSGTNRSSSVVLHEVQRSRTETFHSPHIKSNLGQTPTR
jgi:hypothetical protein